MSIKLELYRVFKMVAEEGSVSAAAKALYISQSAVSQSVRQLEDQLGARLFARSAKGVTLTNAGSMLYDYVQTALRLIGDAETRLAQAQNALAGELVIGAGDTITSCLLLDHLEQFHRRYPNIRLKVLNGTSPEILGLLKRGKVDLAFANLPIDDKSLEVRQRFDIQDVFVAAADYGCDFERVYTPAEIASMPMILLEKNAGSRRYIDSYFLQNAVEPVPEIEVGSHDLVLQMARIGLGVACVIREFAKDRLDSGEICELRVKPPVAPRQVAIVLLENTLPSTACQRFLDELRQDF